MHLTKFRIQHYRSIEDVEITMPEKAPLVLFGPNNAGKSNILSGIDRLLGERYPTYIEMLDSDYFQRDKVTYPKVMLEFLESTPNLTIIEGMVENLIVNDNKD